MLGGQLLWTWVLILVITKFYVLPNLRWAKHKFDTNLAYPKFGMSFRFLWQVKMAEAASHVVIVSSCDNERIFREYCHVKFANSKTTPVLSRGQLERILTCLKDPKNANSKMRFYVKKNKMCRITLQDTNEDAVAKKDKVGIASHTKPASLHRTGVVRS